MFVPLHNVPRDYAWGSRTQIADLLGLPSSGGPEAEYWIGTHPGSPSRIASPTTQTAPTRLSDLTTLPFLLKVLAAAAPLSLQAHPTSSQARAGFDRENALGIALDAPNRNYKDRMHKPELIYALSAEFVALCGFQDVSATRALFERLGSDPVISLVIHRLVDDSSIRSVFEWLLARSPEVDELVDRVVHLAHTTPGPEFAMVEELAAAYPGDPGIVIALLLNRVVLRPGQVLYLPAGNIHAYLTGLGIELMAASDNVLRGGLTPKHVDVAELLSVVNFRPTPVPLLAPARPSAGVEVFRPDVPDFELVVVRPGDGSARYEPAAESLLLCIDGDCTVVGSRNEVRLERGESAYVTPDEGALTFTGSGTVFVATSNSTAAGA